MSKCKYCGSEMWWHDQCGISCLTTQLNRSEARHKIIEDAMEEFRHNIIHNPDVSDNLRVTILSQLDTALTGEPVCIS